MDERPIVKHMGWLGHIVSFLSIFIAIQMIIELLGGPFIIGRHPLLLLLYLLAPVTGFLSQLYTYSRIENLEIRAEAQKGTVLAADRGTVGGSGTAVCTADVTVEYRHDGTRYRTSALYPTDPKVRFKPDEVDELLSEYEIDSETTVYVDRSDPTNAYLRPYPESIANYNDKWFYGAQYVVALGYIWIKLVVTLATA